MTAAPTAAAPPTEPMTLADELVELLGDVEPPVALTVRTDPPPLDGAASGPPRPEPAGCCFWHPAEDRVVDTIPADHAACSVGSYTHGLLDLADAATASDTGALVGSGWVSPEELAHTPRLPLRPAGIRYSPLREATRPDVVLLRLSPAALTTLQSACPELAITGKPQCQIVPLAYAGHAAVSPGCAISRHRTGLPAGQLTCALPADQLPELLARLRRTTAADQAVLSWAERNDHTNHLGETS